MIRLSLLILLAGSCQTASQLLPSVTRSGYGVRYMPEGMALRFGNPTIEITEQIAYQTSNKMANDILRHSRTNNSIYMLINSPGGSVSAGNLIISAMNIAKLRGVTFVCLSTKYAHSMAFILMLHCDKRYALEGTRFLIHGVRYYSAPFQITENTEQTTKQAHEDLRRANIQFLNMITKSSGISLDVLKPAFYGEKVWDVEELERNTYYGWITVTNAVNTKVDIFNHNPELIFNHGDSSNGF